MPCVRAVGLFPTESRTAVEETREIAMSRRQPAADLEHHISSAMPVTNGAKRDKMLGGRPRRAFM